MRKVICMALAVILLMVASPAYAQTQFTDVQESDWFYVGIMEVVDKQLFVGTSDTTFSPKDTMDRGMFITVLGKLAGVNTADYPNKGSFLDVPETAYYTPYINWAVEKGICVGVGYNLFAPKRQITREEAMLMLYNYAGAYQIKLEQVDQRTVVFTDIRNLSDISRKAITAMYSALVIDGKTSTTFDPKARLTRAEAAQIFAKAYYILNGLTKTLTAQTALTGEEGIFTITLPAHWQMRVFTQSGDNHLGTDDGSYYMAAYASLTDNPAELFWIDVVAENGTRKDQYYYEGKLRANYQLMNRIEIAGEVYLVLLHRDDSPLSQYQNETLTLYRRIWYSRDAVINTLQYSGAVTILP